MKRDWYRIANIANAAANTPTRVDIYDEIGSGPFQEGTTASAFVADLAGINGDLDIHINSPGGNVFDGLAIYNAIANRPGKVTTHVDGLAASAASFIAQAGKTRIISPGAMVMIHDAQGLALGNAGDMREMAGLLDKASDNIAGLYAAHSGQPVDGWRDAMRAETWYTAQEAVDAGLADKLAERPVSDDALAAVAHFDLSPFAKVPEWVGNRSHVDGHQAGTAKPDGWHDGSGHPLTLTVQPGGLSQGDFVSQVREQVHAMFDDFGHPLVNWDGGAAMSRAAKSSDPAAAYRAICAGRKNGDPAKQSSWALPHHPSPGAAPDPDGVRNALARLPQTQGLTNEAAAKKHLDEHMAAISPDHDADDTSNHADPMPAWLKALTA